MFLFSKPKPKPKKTTVKIPITKPISTSFDTYNEETSNLFTSTFNGLKMELSKVVTPFLQLSTSRSLDKNQKTHQSVATFSFPSSIFQVQLDSSKTFSLRSSFMTGPFISKFQSIYSNSTLFSQFSSVYNSSFYNIGFKLIKPTLKASDFIYILNTWKAFGKFCFGMEVLSMQNQLGVSLSGRYENSPNSVACFNLQRFNTMTLSFYKKIFKSVELGLEYKKSKNETKTSMAARIQNYKTDVRYLLNSKALSFIWIERLSENLSIEFNSEYDYDKFDYGIGINFVS